MARSSRSWSAPSAPSRGVRLPSLEICASGLRLRTAFMVSTEEGVVSTPSRAQSSSHACRARPFLSGQRSCKALSSTRRMASSGSVAMGFGLSTLASCATGSTTCRISPWSVRWITSFHKSLSALASAAPTAPVAVDSPPRARSDEKTPVVFSDDASCCPRPCPCPSPPASKSVNRSRYRLARVVRSASSFARMWRRASPVPAPASASVGMHSSSTSWKVSSSGRWLPSYALAPSVLPRPRVRGVAGVWPDALGRLRKEAVATALRGLLEKAAGDAYGSARVPPSPAKPPGLSNVDASPCSCCISISRFNAS